MRNKKNDRKKKERNEKFKERDKEINMKLIKKKEK